MNYWRKFGKYAHERKTEETFKSNCVLFKENFRATLRQILHKFMPILND